MDKPAITAEPTWTPADSAALYRVDDWGQGLFQINDLGDLAVCPAGSDGPQIDLKQLTDDLERRALSTPLLLRFTDILRHRLDAIAGAFAKAIADHDYRGTYQAVYPIKVNQQRHVVE